MKTIVSIALITGAVILGIDVYRDASIHDKRLMIIGLYFVTGVYTLYSFIKNEEKRGVVIAAFLLVSSLLLLCLEWKLYLSHKDYSHLHLYDFILVVILFKGCFNLISYYRNKRRSISSY
jgi:hypothetical protein